MYHTEILTAFVIVVILFLFFILKYLQKANVYNKQLIEVSAANTLLLVEIAEKLGCNKERSEFVMDCISSPTHGEVPEIISLDFYAKWASTATHETQIKKKIRKLRNERKNDSTQKQ